jgi:hypothetical protein
MRTIITTIAKLALFIFLLVFNPLSALVMQPCLFDDPDDDDDDIDTELEQTQLYEFRRIN